MTDTLAAQIGELEHARGRALVEADYPSLAALLADDLVHIHATGAIETKAEYLSNVESKLEFRSVTRPILNVRLFGDVAVSTGLLEQSVRVKAADLVVDMKAAVTQVWRRDGESWRLCSFHATNVA